MDQATGIVTEFMKVSTACETFLQQDGDLTLLQQQSIDATIQSLRTMWTVWSTHRQF